MMAASVEVEAGGKKYLFEEHDDYILVEELQCSSAGPACSASAGCNILSKDCSASAGSVSSGAKKEHVKSMENSLDSGYDSKMVAYSPEAGADPMASLENKGWCVLKEEDKCRPNGLYGFRYMDYDDQEAEGNIHITDDDL